MTLCFHETRETIDLLRRVVDKLDETNGCISAEDLWDGVECVPANVRSNNPTVARLGIRQMGEFAEVLQSFTSKLVSTYRNHIYTTRERNRIPHLTVESLPNEIIHHIVNDAVDVQNASKTLTLIKYSHISSKIRRFILDSPSLWASIPLSLDIPSILLSTVIKRSADLGLIVDIHAGRPKELFHTMRKQLRPESMLSRLSVIFKYDQRWKELTISTFSPAASFILEHFPRVNLKSIRGLRVWGGEDVFFKKWEFPPLVNLNWDMREYSPPSSMATQILHTCTLKLYMYHDSKMLMKTAAFLNAASNLHSLALDFNLYSSGTDGEIPEIRLSCLTHLDIQFHDEKLGPTAIFLKSIQCPGLKVLSLQAATHGQYSDLTENMQERYPVLTFFTLFMRRYFPPEDFFFDDIMRPLPSTIRNIRLQQSSDDVNLQASRSDNLIQYNLCDQYPNLAELDLRDCSVLGENFYARLSEILRNFRVTLNYFRPGDPNRREKQHKEEKNAILTLRHAGVLQWGKADFRNSEQAAILSVKLRFQKFCYETKGETFIYAIKKFPDFCFKILRRQKLKILLIELGLN